MREGKLRKAIDSMCKQCLYDPKAGLGTWREQVEACTAPKCALYEFRATSYSVKNSV